MTTPPDSGAAPVESEQDALHSELIALTYATVADPERFHDLIEIWEKCLSAQILAEDDLAARGALSTHFNSALGIFDQIGRAKRETDRARTILELLAVPALICDGALNILQCNNRLTAALEGDLVLDDLHDGELARQITEWTEDTPVAFVPSGHDRHGIGAAVITELPDAFRNNTNGGHAFLVVFNEIAGDDEAWALFREKYDLTPAETDVFAMLANGQRADEIAEARGVSINTIRVHIRSLLEKTGSRSQNDLVRSSVFILSQFQSLKLVSRALDPADQRRLPASSRVLLPSGRMLHFREFGAPGGLPVVYLHGMMAGPDMPGAVKEHAARNNIRIIAPSRPGFGKSDTIPATDMELVRQSCRDLYAFLDILSIPRAFIIGNLTAGGIALNFADRFPNRCVGVLCTGYSGLMDDALIEGMGTLTRAFARTYQRSRTALRFLTRAAVASVDFLGADRMMQRHLGTSPVDLEFCIETGCFEMMADGLRHAVAQGGDAFIKDGFLALADWRDLIERLRGRVPIACVLGADDLIAPNAIVPDLAEGLDHYEITRCPGAGQLVLFQKWEDVIAGRVRAAFEGRALPA